MSYKYFLLIAAALAGDYLVGSALSVAPLFLVVAVFIISIKFDYLTSAVFALLGGLLFDIAQLSSSVYASVFLVSVSLVITLFAKRLFDLDNKITQSLLLLGILIVKSLTVWMVYGPSWPSGFLVSSVVVSFLVALVYGFSVLTNAKKT